MNNLAAEFSLGKLKKNEFKKYIFVNIFLLFINVKLEKIIIKYDEYFI